MNARMWRTGTIFVLLLSLVALAGWGQGVVPKGIIPNPPESTVLQVSIWVDRGAYAVGDSITVHYNVNKSAYIYIWDIDADGQWTPVFPNSLLGGTNNYVTAGEHTLPGSWSVSPPLGTEYLQILATGSPVDPFAMPVGDAAALLAQIQASILGILPVTERAWSFTNFDVVQGSTSAYGKLNVSTTPSGASIYIDGMYRGYTPRSVYAPQGFRTLVLSLPGYQTRQEIIYVIGGVTRTISRTLQGSGSANQPPVSLFTFSPTSPGVGEYVHFDGSASSDPDGSISAYSWNFGNGLTDSILAPWTRFLAAGLYTVSLTVTDNRGATSTSTQTVRVGAANQPPVASFTTDPVIGTPGGWIKFDASTSMDPDGTIATYAWNFGDGRSAVGGPVYWQAYPTAGTYAVTLTVTDNLSASASVTRTVQVGSTNQPPVASFSVPTAPTVGTWTRLDATGSNDPDGFIVSYQWTYGDGQAEQLSTTSAYHTYMTAGTFVVTLVVTDNGGATNSTTQFVQVGASMQAPVPLFTYSPASPLAGSPVVFNATASYDPDGQIVTYQWDLNGDGTIDLAGSGKTAQATYSTPRTVAVRLTVTDNNGLSASTTQTIVVTSGGGSSGTPAMGTTPGFFVWGSDTWHVTVNAGAGWTTPHSYRIELRTNGQFSTFNETWTGVAPMGIIPTPAPGSKTLLLEGSIQVGSVDYTFTIPGARSMWMSLKMDENGDSTLEESTNFVYLRAFMVRPPFNPLVVGLPSGVTGDLIPSLNFRIGTASSSNYTETRQSIVYWTTIGALESL